MDRPRSLYRCSRRLARALLPEVFPFAAYWNLVRPGTDVPLTDSGTPFVLTKFEGPHPDVQGETVAVGYTRYGQREVAITADVNEETQFEMIVNRKHLGFFVTGQSGANDKPLDSSEKSHRSKALERTGLASVFSGAPDLKRWRPRFGVTLPASKRGIAPVWKFNRIARAAQTGCTRRLASLIRASGGCRASALTRG